VDHDVAVCADDRQIGQLGDLAFLRGLTKGFKMVDLRISPAELSEPFFKIKPAPWYFADKIVGCGKHLADFRAEGQSLSGVIRWFANFNDVWRWGDLKEELIDHYPDSKLKSVTFIASGVFDNRTLLEKDSGYLANL
jgi:hypothetical protein